LTGTDQAVQVGNRVLQLGGITLNHTAGGDEQLTTVLTGCQLPQGFRGLLAGRFQEAAGVHNDHIGIIRGRHATMSGLGEQNADSFGIGHVFRTTKGD